MKPLACQKEAFSLPPGLHYLNAAYMSPLPRRVEAAGVRALARKRVPSEITPDDFFRDLDVVRERFAALIGAEASRVAVIPSASYGLATVARNTVLARGQRVVIAGGQFPSNVYVWRRLAGRVGASVRVVEPPAVAVGRGREWNQRIVEAIDAATGVVAIGPVHWADGTRFDLEAIGAAARARGAALVVDGTQGVGAVPFDVGSVRPDAVVCAAYKWLLGPYGIGVAYYGARYDDGEPLEETWAARVGSEDFRRLVEYGDAYRPGAVRYDVGEASSFALVPMLLEGLDVLRDWGVERIAAYCGALAGDFVAEVRRLGFGVEDEGWRAPHLFGLRMPREAVPDRLQATLQARRVAVSVRGDFVRVSPHVYNDSGDVGALLDALRAARGGA